jgi:phosphoribosylformylglycinamidine (FGAM) synthase-like amidotransferase family enzyme
MDRPKVLITTGVGFNSHDELGYCFRLAGADVDFMRLLDVLDDTEQLDSYQGLGLPGGFTGGDHLGAGQFIANLTRGNPKAFAKLEEKVNDIRYPVLFVCNSAQYSAKLNMYPVPVGTVQNDSGKHETGYWDISIDPKCDSCWFDYIRHTKEPIFAPISHGEGRFYLTDDGLAEAKDQNIIAMRYSKGALYSHFIHSRGDIYNPNGSTDDIAGLAWKSNLALFPHFERLHKNVQRPDRQDVKDRGGKLLDHYEPTILLFKGAVDFMRTQMR